MTTELLQFSRRRFLRLAGWITAAVGVPLPVVAHTEHPSVAIQARRLIAALGAHESRRRIGTAYLRRHRGESDTGALVTAVIAAHPRLARHLRQGEAGALRAALQAGVQRDFARGDTAMVNGWLLSRTEARLCALVAIDQA